MAYSSSDRRRVLVTGAAGRIGRGFARATAGVFDLRLTDLPGADTSELNGCGEIRPGRLDRPGDLPALVEGIDTVVHLAGQPSPEAPWERLLPDNIEATYNVFAAAERAGCRRVVYASSIHAVSGHPADRPVRTSDVVAPEDLYGVTKCFGEALGRFMAEQRGLSVVAVRIGAFQPVSVAAGPGADWLSDMWIAPSDLFQLLRRAVETPDIGYAVVHAASANDVQRLDISDTRELLGYEPEYGWSGGTGQNMSGSSARIQS
jgi:uronate dehydrogenase